MVIELPPINYKEKNSQAILHQIFGFRKIYALKEIHDVLELGKELEGNLLELFNELSYEFYRLGGTAGEYLEVVKSFLNTIKYVSYDAEKIWPSHDKMCNTHDMSKEILGAYKLSMDELHSGLDFEWEILRPIFEGKVVMDFGCGNGFFARKFLNYCNPKRLYLVDRTEILGNPFGYSEDSIFTLQEEYDMVEVLTENQFKSYTCKTPEYSSNNPFSYIEYIGERIDVLWLSEVIHSKQEPIKFMELFENIMSPSASVLINSLRPNTQRSLLFNMQMELHAKIGAEARVQQKLFFEKVQWTMDFSIYHEISCAPFEYFSKSTRRKEKVPVTTIKCQGCGNELSCKYSGPIKISKYFISVGWHITDVESDLNNLYSCPSCINALRNNE